MSDGRHIDKQLKITEQNKLYKKLVKEIIDEIFQQKKGIESLLADSNIIYNEDFDIKYLQIQPDFDLNAFVSNYNGHLTIKINQSWFELFPNDKNIDLRMKKIKRLLRPLICHELGHVIGKHHFKKLCFWLIPISLITLIIIISNQLVSHDLRLPFLIMGIVCSLLFSLFVSSKAVRNFEEEADYYSKKLTSPEELKDLLEFINNKYPQKDTRFNRVFAIFSTHPFILDRIKLTDIKNE